MAARRLVLALAVLALLAAQALGLLHRVVHSPLVAPALQVAAGAAGAAYAQVHAHSALPANVADPFGKLFTGHGSDADCRAYDQIGHSDAMPPVAAPALPVIVPASVLQFFAGEFIARWAALFEARGPPSVR
jgi:hypothetical protein